MRKEEGKAWSSAVQADALPSAYLDGQESLVTFRRRLLKKFSDFVRSLRCERTTRSKIAEGGREGEGERRRAKLGLQQSRWTPCRQVVCVFVA